MQSINELLSAIQNCDNEIAVRNEKKSLLFSQLEVVKKQEIDRFIAEISPQIALLGIRHSHLAHVLIKEDEVPSKKKGSRKEKDRIPAELKKYYDPVSGTGWSGCGNKPYCMRGVDMKKFENPNYVPPAKKANSTSAQESNASEGPGSVNAEIRSLSVEGNPPQNGSDSVSAIALPISPICVPANSSPTPISHTESILSDVSWSFFGEKILSRSEFDEEVFSRQLAISASESWNPERVAVLAPKIRIEDPMSRPEFSNGIELSSDNGVWFTDSELLFMLHNLMVDIHKDLGEHTFFEGLSLVERSAGGPPMYRIDLGS